ncbi:uncharacterized protein TNCV_4398181 [Trichonephila clavipes]|nr:uncharacterized protein TNCV_4398181 [Trichonephila clavipes]
MKHHDHVGNYLFFYIVSTTVQAFFISGNQLGYTLFKERYRGERLVVGALDSRLEGLGLMADSTKYTPSTHEKSNLHQALATLLPARREGNDNWNNKKSSDSEPFLKFLSLKTMKVKPVKINLQLVEKFGENVKSDEMVKKWFRQLSDRPQANRTERVNRDLVQMIANYVNELHATWDQFLRDFAYAIRTAVKETTGKPPAELFLGRKLITPFQKLVIVSDGTEFAVGDIERLFEEAR